MRERRAMRRVRTRGRCGDSPPPAKDLMKRETDQRRFSGEGKLAAVTRMAADEIVSVLSHSPVLPLSLRLSANQG